MKSRKVSKGIIAILIGTMIIFVGLMIVSSGEKIQAFSTKEFIADYGGYGIKGEWETLGTAGANLIFKNEEGSGWIILGENKYLVAVSKQYVIEREGEQSVIYEGNLIENEGIVRFAVYKDVMVGEIELAEIIYSFGVAQTLESARYILNQYNEHLEEEIIEPLLFEDLIVPDDRIVIPATVDIYPDILNLKSKGGWITAYIELPKHPELSEFDVDQIDVNTIKLNDQIFAENNPKYGFVKNPDLMDRDGDGLLEYMVKFNRADVQNILEPSNRVKIEVTGSLIDGRSFYGLDWIRATGEKPEKPPTALEGYSNDFGEGTERSEEFLTELVSEYQGFAEPELPEEASTPGKTEGVGTYFEIKDSEYLNIVLKSSEKIKVVLESIPRMISLDIEAATEKISSMELTIASLEPNKTYYKYQDSYKNETVLVSDENGSYSWEQDLTQPYHLWIQEIRGTIFIGTDTVLTSDLNDSVEITANNIILNCNNHKITGRGPGYGIYLNNKSGITIKNCVISNFWHDIYLYNSSSNTLSDNTVTNKYNKYASGIFLYNSPNNTLIDNTATSNEAFGIYLYRSGNSSLINNTMADNRDNFALSGTSDDHFINTIDTTNTVDGKPLYYILNATDQVYDGATNAGIFYCIMCNNVMVKDLILTKNSHVFFWKTQNSRIEKITAPSNTYGISLHYSNNNTILNNQNYGTSLIRSNQNTLLGNEGGISLSHSNNNTLINNISYGIGYAGIFLFSSNNNTLDGNTAYSNRYYGIFIERSAYNTLINNNTSNNPSGGIFLIYSNNTILEGNNVPSNNFWGIILHNSPDSFLRRNIISGNRWNFAVYGAFIHNIDSSNKINGKSIQYLVNKKDLVIDSSWDVGYLGIVNSTNITVKDLTLSNNGQGVLFAYSNNSKIENVSVSETRDGILLYHQSSNNTLIRNNISNNIWGIPIVDSSDNNTIINNNISNNYYGIDLTSSSGVTIVNNTVVDNTETGIHVWCSSNNGITDNNVSRNKYGVLFWGYRTTDNNTIADNNISDNNYGVYFYYYTSNNLITNNTIFNNGYGLYFNFSSNNKIYHNNFIANVYQIYVYKANNNTFDDGYPSGGNYWSDYTGMDEKSGPDQDQPGSDGIGDTPHAFPNGQDNYPFMEENGWEVPIKRIVWVYAVADEEYIDYYDSWWDPWDDDQWIWEMTKAVELGGRAFQEEFQIVFLVKDIDFWDSDDSTDSLSVLFDEVRREMDKGTNDIMVAFTGQLNWLTTPYHGLAEGEELCTEKPILGDDVIVVRVPSFWVDNVHQHEYSHLFGAPDHDRCGEGEIRCIMTYAWAYQINEWCSDCYSKIMVNKWREF